jgi:Cdc6-like AAA superfamily ATPase
MDDWQMARMALDMARTAARIAEREQRRRQREQRDRRQPAKEAPPERRPEFEMPTSANGEIPDEFLPHP